jgi:uncharacterized protein YjiS (DUF1127 family)
MHDDIPNAGRTMLRGTLFLLHPESPFGRWRLHRRERRAEEAMLRLPPHLQADIGLTPREVPAPSPEVAATRLFAGRWS